MSASFRWDDLAEVLAAEGFTTEVGRDLLRATAKRPSVPPLLAVGMTHPQSGRVEELLFLRDLGPGDAARLGDAELAALNRLNGLSPSMGFFVDRGRLWARSYVPVAGGFEPAVVAATLRHQADLLAEPRTGAALATLSPRA